MSDDVAVVQNTVKVTDPTHKEDTGCVGRCCKCLAAIPCGTLSAWVMLVVAVSACGGALMVGAERTRDLLHRTDYLWFADPVSLGVLFGMVFVGVVFLIVATISSIPLSHNVFSSQAKNLCARALQVVVIIFQLLFLLGWIAATCVISVPVMLLTLLHMLHASGYHCIDLRDYALAEQDHSICGMALNVFHERSIDLLECYCIALVASVLVCFSLVFFLMCAASNFTHLRNDSECSVYKKDVRTSKNSVMDTRM